LWGAAPPRQAPRPCLLGDIGSDQRQQWVIFVGGRGRELGGRGAHMLGEKGKIYSCRGFYSMSLTGIRIRHDLRCRGCRHAGSE
jgi:hypothetical protein